MIMAKSGHMMLDFRHNCYKANSTSRRSYWVSRTTKKILRLKNVKTALRRGVGTKSRILECSASSHEWGVGAEICLYLICHVRKRVEEKPRALECSASSN
eukprot:sb/3478650/